jgi:hypothetical protein
MRIEFDEVPVKDGYITVIHLCSKCPDTNECEVQESKKKGWCHTFKKEGE